MADTVAVGPNGLQRLACWMDTRHQVAEAVGPQTNRVLCRTCGSNPRFASRRLANRYSDRVVRMRLAPRAHPLAEDPPAGCTGRAVECGVCCVICRARLDACRRRDVRIEFASAPCTQFGRDRVGRKRTRSRRVLVVVQPRVRSGSRSHPSPYARASQRFADL